MHNAFVLNSTRFSYNVFQSFHGPQIPIVHPAFPKVCPDVAIRHLQMLVIADSSINQINYTYYMIFVHSVAQCISWF